MRACKALVAAAATAALSVSAAPAERRASSTNGTITTNGGAFAESNYDYIVVGGGLAGLVVATRLSEDPDLQVAVIEAGPSGVGDANLTTPSANLYASSVKTHLDWQYTTTPQEGLGGREADWPRGKVLGGSSAINGLYMIRPNEVEVDAWASLVNTSTAQDKWGWKNLVKYMQKSETFHAPRKDVTDTLNSKAGEGANVLQYNADTRGSSGPIDVTWPGTQYPNVGAYIQAVNNMGLPVNSDPYNGNNTGPFVATSGINPSNWTRSFSRTGYLDPLLGARPNLHVLVGHQVTKINFDTSNSSAIKALGVSYAQGPNDQVYTINATSEVILSAGAIGTPQLLQLSGVGNKDLLSQMGIDQVLAIDSVGWNLQDHLSSAITYSPASGTSTPPTEVTGNAIIDSYVNDATSYVDLATLTGNHTAANALVSSVNSGIDAAVKAYHAPGSAQQGYRAVLQKMAEVLPNVGPIEILLANSFGNVQLQVALQHAVSRGSVQLASDNAFDQPKIDAGYLSDPHGVDQQILRHGFEVARAIGQTAPLKSFLGEETSPGLQTQSDSQWNQFIASTSGTEFHPSSTCSMLPRNSGGVVDEDLIVYGTSNLRIVDASVPPISMSMHIMTLLYGFSEAAADLIKFSRNGTEFPSGKPIHSDSSSSSHSDSSRSASAAGQTSAANSNSQAQSSKAGAAGTVTPTWATAAFGAMTAMGALLML